MQADDLRHENILFATGLQIRLCLSDARGPCLGHPECDTLANFREKQATAHLGYK